MNASPQPLPVAFDTSFLYIAKGGISRYITCLLNAFRTLGADSLQLCPIGFRVPNYEYRQPSRMLKTAARELVWQPFLARREIVRSGCRLFHMPFSADFGLPRNIRTISTLHDLHYVVTPERFRPWTRFRARREMEKIAATNRIICVSQSTADDAMRILHIPARKLEVIHLGCDFDLSTPEEPVPFPLPERFFLFVSSLEPGKNLSLLRETWELAEAEGQSLPPLVVVGKRIEGVATEGAPPKSWIYAGRLPDPQVVHLYRRAVAFLYPSKYEGFGIPILEAMALGCPAVCSPVSSLPEVGGNAAIYANQTPAAYLSAIQRLLDEPALRDEKIQSGFERVKNFTWAKTARETLEVYRSLA